MENLKRVALIASKARSKVERVTAKANTPSALSQPASRSRQLRLKTVQCGHQSKLTKDRLQDIFERASQTDIFELKEDYNWLLSGEKLEILSKWWEGHTLADEDKREYWNPNAANKVRERIRLWVRFFEHLALWHKAGILHGSIKPGNLLICENLPNTVSTKQTSEFFAKYEDVPLCALLDGGYAHILEQNVHAPLVENGSLPKIQWGAPEVTGILEGAYGEYSDVFSMAAVMAWDLGLMDVKSDHQGHIMSAFWPIYSNPQSNIVYFGNTWYIWKNKSPIVEAAKKLKSLLSRILEPHFESRILSAKAVAFELMIIANRITDVSKNPHFDAECQPLDAMDMQANKLTQEGQLDNVLKIFDVAEDVKDFATENGGSSRLWCVATNNNPIARKMARRLSSALLISGKSVFYFHCRPSDRLNSFGSINRLFRELIDRVCNTHSEWMSEFQTELTSTCLQGLLLYQTLPALRPLFNSESGFENKLDQLKILSRDEALHFSIQKILTLICNKLNLRFIIIDDIHRCDSVSMKVFHDFMAIPPNTTCKFIISLAGSLTPKDSNRLKILNDLKSQDTVWEGNGLEHKHIWLQKLNQIDPPLATTLSYFSIIEGSIRSEDIENILNFIQESKDFKNTQYFENKNNFQIYNSNLVVEPDSATLESKAVSASKERTHFGFHLLQDALKQGLLYEDRCYSTGNIYGYFFSSSRISLGLKLILSNKEINEVKNVIEKKDIYSVSLADMITKSESLCDATEAYEFYKNWQKIEEKIERMKLSIEKSETLVPKIREQIGKIALNLGHYDVSSKYFQAVLWNTDSVFKKIRIEMMKFNPPEYTTRAERNRAFEKCFQEAEEHGIIPPLENLSETNPNQLLEFICYRIDKYRTSAKVTDENWNDDLKELEEAAVLFLEKSAGWVDTRNLFVECIRILHIIHQYGKTSHLVRLLMLVVVCGERYITPQNRHLVLERATTLASEDNNEIAIGEALLLKAWSTIFFDGLLTDAKRTLDSLKSLSQQFPPSINSVTNKLSLIIDLESFSGHNSVLFEKQTLFKKLQDLDLSQWEIGLAYCGIIPFSIHKVTMRPPKCHQVITSIIEEKLEQMLYCSLLSLEGSQIHSNLATLSESKSLGLRDWFGDPLQHLDYLPTSFSKTYVESNALIGDKNVDSKEKSTQSKVKNVKIFKNQKGFKFKTDLKRNIKNEHKKEKYSLDKEKKNDPHYIWSDDLSLKFNIKFDKQTTHDPEKLILIAKNFAQSGFLWTSYRLCKKAGTDINHLINEMPEVSAKLKNNPLSQRSTLLTSTQPQAVALNYVLEFLHNFQRNSHDLAMLNALDKSVLAECLLRSIPTTTTNDPSEHTIAEAIKAAVRRMDTSQPNFKSNQKVSQL